MYLIDMNEKGGTNEKLSYFWLDTYCNVFWFYF
jgi:hypothetical protein